MIGQEVFFIFWIILKFLELIDKIKEEFIFILINHIDSPQLRSRQQQEALSILVRSKRIRLIASVDHVNAALLWDQVFNFWINKARGDSVYR